MMEVGSYSVIIILLIDMCVTYYLLKVRETFEDKLTYQRKEWFSNYQTLQTEFSCMKEEYERKLQYMKQRKEVFEAKWKNAVKDKNLEIKKVANFNCFRLVAMYDLIIFRERKKPRQRERDGRKILGEKSLKK